MRTCKWGMMILVVLAMIFGQEAGASALEEARLHGATGKVTFRVVDDEGRPVSSARVEAYLSVSDTRDGFTTHSGVTDTGGMFTVEGKVKSDMVYRITKQGSYRTDSRYWFHAAGAAVEEGRWLPWNPVLEVVLKPKKNPVPMYARRVEVEIPLQGQPVGFDLEKADWVKPFGEGVVSDLLVTVSGAYEKLLQRQVIMDITFNNLSDGIIGVSALNDGSELKSGYEAPVAGYKTSYSYEKIIVPEREGRINQYPRVDKDYLFRVRSVLDDNEYIISAIYGKVYGDIMADFKDKDRIGLYFTYYLNPTPNDRNLEFDPSRNLFEGLSSGERVLDP